MVLIKSRKANKRLENGQKKKSNKRVRTSDDTVEVGILFQNQDIGPVIGKGGENINNIRQESGAVVTTSKFNQRTPDRTMKILGSVEQVTNAIKLVIDTVCKEKPKTKENQMITLLAEYTNCGFLIGKQGKTIKEVREKTGANVQVKKECIGNSTQKEISITGDHAAVTGAIDAVVTHLAQGNNPTRMAYVPGVLGGIPYLGAGFSNAASSGRGWVLPTAGQGGGLFQQSSFGDVLPQALFGGSGGGVQGMPPVLGGINAGGADASVIRMEMTLWVPKEVIGKVIGHGGSVIRRIRDQSTAHVFVHKDEDEDNKESSERKITIKGNKKSIGIACSLIETLVMG